MPKVPMNTDTLRSTSVPVRSPSAPVRSPFEGHAVGPRPNAAGQIGVHFTAAMLPSFTLISTWISGIDGLLAAMTDVFGTNLPQRIGQTTPTEFGTLMRTGPEEFVLVGDDTSDRSTMLRARIGADTGSVTDLSHARCRIHIEGAQCHTVLNKLFALDLRASAFAIGDVALTGTHHVPSMLHRVGSQAWDLYVFTTYAHDQLGTLLDAALEYGVALSTQHIAL